MLSRARCPALVTVVLAALGMLALAACASTPAKQVGRPGRTHPASTGARHPRPTSHAAPHVSAPPRKTATPRRTPPKPSATRRPPPADPPAQVGRRIVAYYGAGTHLPVLGVLGRTGPETAWAQLSSQAAQYARPGAPVQCAFELIATIANAVPGPDGMYRTRQPAAVLDRYLHTVQEHHGLLILDIQPGRSDFLTEAAALRPWLAQPDVSLALDPEWRMGPDQVPAKQVGSVSAAEVNRVSAWLNELVISHHLPPKLLLLHKFRSTMLQDEGALLDRPHLREVVNMDGFGPQSQKLPKYRDFAAASRFEMGIKLFYRQDTDLMTPAQVLALQPTPAVIDYQ